MPPTRNSLCPCGSGRKYKRCHGAALATQSKAPAIVDPLVARANAVKRTDMELHDLLMRFTHERGGADWLERAVGVILGDAPRQLADAEAELALPWVLHHYPSVNTGESMAEVMAYERRDRLAPALMRMIDAQLDSYLSVWRVTGIAPGVGIELADLLTGKTEFVYEVTASKSVRGDDAILARVVLCDGVAFIAGMHGYTLPPLAAEQVVHTMRRYCRVRTRPIKADRLRDPHAQLDLLGMWRDMIEAQFSPPQMTNTDGDPLSFLSDRFEFDAGAHSAVLAALKKLDGASDANVMGDVTEMVVTKSSAPRTPISDTTVVARLELHSTRLIVESTSTRRADEIRKRIETALGTQIHHRLRSETTAASMFEDAQKQNARGAAASSRAPDMTPDVQEAMRQFREQYMQRWLDESIPALKGLTPREAAANPKHHRALDVLLRDIEYQDSRMPAGERTDIAALRATLGMPRAR